VGIAVEPGVDRQNPCRGVQQGERQGAPVGRVADRKQALRAEPREQAFKEIDSCSAIPSPFVTLSPFLKTRWYGASGKLPK
jgi:hypothetical protein